MATINEQKAAIRAAIDAFPEGDSIREDLMRMFYVRFNEHP